MSRRLDDRQILEVEPYEVKYTWSALEDLADSTDVSTVDTDGLVHLAVGATGTLPPRLLRAVHEYRSRAGAGDVLLVRGLLPAGEALGPTPPDSVAPLTGPGAQRAALHLLAIALLLGEPFNFRTLYQGRLVQHVVPVPGMEATQTGESSRGMLDWHVEDGFSDDRCDYFGLLCLRGDPGALTEFASMRDVRLPAGVEEVLRRPRFHMLPDTAHVLDGFEPVPVPVLTGPPECTEISFDAHYLRPADPGDREAAAALAALGAALDEVRVGHALEPGDLLVLDNRRVVHARTPFQPRYDGADRWLVRTMVCASLPRFRRYGRRIIR